MEDTRIQARYKKIKQTLIRYISNIGKNPYRLEKIKEQHPSYTKEFEKEIQNSLEIIKEFCEIFDIFSSFEAFSKELTILQPQIREKVGSIYRLIMKIGDQGEYLKSITEGSIPPENKYQKILNSLEQQNKDIDFLSLYHQQTNKEIEDYFSEDKELFLHSKHLLKHHLDFFQTKKEKARLDAEIKEFAKKAEENQKVFEKISSDILLERQEIHKLKKDAIQQGLAQRYTQEKKNLNDEKKEWERKFRNSILWLIGLGGLEIAIFLLSIFCESLQKIINTPVIYLGLLPIHIALIWFILFASRRRNEANRLASDYAHKEVFASSYEAYQEEIKNLKAIYPDKEKELTELNIKLLDSMIGVLSDNPAKSLDTKKTTDELPAKELVNLASEVIKLKGK